MARGSIYSRELRDGTVVFDVRYRSSNGAQRHKRGFRRRRDAERYLNEQLASVDRGDVVVTSTTFAAYFDAWLAEHRPRLEDGTYRDYEITGRKRLKPFFGEMKLCAITQRDVRRWVAELAASGQLAPKTINNSIVTLRVCLGHAVEDGLIGNNPAASRIGARERIKLPEAHREMDYLRLEEIPVYLAACSRTYRPLAEVLIATGMRIGEALALRWGDVDLEARRIRVLRSAKRGGEGSTKGDRARSVDFGPRLEAVLRDLWAYQALWLRMTPETPVFATRHGKVPERSSVSMGPHKAALRRAGLRSSLRLHDLRHTAAAAWLSAGLPLIYVQRQLGHASMTTTESVYGHLEEGFLRDAPERAEQAIWEEVRPRAA